MTNIDNSDFQWLLSMTASHLDAEPYTGNGEDKHNDSAQYERLRLQMLHGLVDEAPVTAPVEAPQVDGEPTAYLLQRWAGSEGQPVMVCSTKEIADDTIRMLANLSTERFTAEPLPLQDR